MARRVRACFGLGARGPGNLLGVVELGGLCAPIASPSWPASGLGGCAARGRHWWCHGPGRGGRRNRHGGRGAGASTRDGAGCSPASQPTRGIPGGSCRQSGGWQRCLRQPASQVGAPTRQAQRQGRQEAQGSTGQAQQPRERQLRYDQEHGQLGSVYTESHRHGHRLVGKGSCAALSRSASPSTGCRHPCSEVVPPDPGRAGSPRPVAARRPAHAHGPRPGDVSPAHCPPCRLVGISDTRW
jgi:hypothetical protein